MKHIVSAAVFAFVFLCLTGCTGFEVSDPGSGTTIVWSPVIAHFKIVDAKGNDLLDPDNPDNVADKLTLTFKGETYRARFIPGFDENKSSFATGDEKYGLVIGKFSLRWNGMPGGYWLYFGAIDGKADMDEDLVLSIEGKNQWTIHYHCSDHVYDYDEDFPSCDRSWTMDGKTTDSSFFFLTVS